MIAKRWPMMLVLAAATVAALTNVVPAAGASTGAATTSCPRTLLIGLHGVGEGPSPQMPNKYSPTINATFTAFAKDANAEGQAGNYETHWFSYPTVPRKDLGSSSGLYNAVKTVNATEVKLANYIDSRYAPCAEAGTNTLISVVGFSMGAWVINSMLSNQGWVWPELDLVLQYGDPCWSNSNDGSEGLVQRFSVTPAIQAAMGCVPAETYPYDGIFNPYTAFSICAANDPVCGEGYNLLTLAQQFQAANNCTQTNGCTHFKYPSDGATTYGAQWLANYGFVRSRARFGSAPTGVIGFGGVGSPPVG